MEVGVGLGNPVSHFVVAVGRLEAQPADILDDLGQSPELVVLESGDDARLVGFRHPSPEIVVARQGERRIRKGRFRSAVQIIMLERRDLEFGIFDGLLVARWRRR